VLRRLAAPLARNVRGGVKLELHLTANRKAPVWSCCLQDEVPSRGSFAAALASAEVPFPVDYAFALRVPGITVAG
jgi:hypothetical protein